MHVLFFAEEFPAARKAIGGVRVSVRKQAEELARRGHRVTVVTLERRLPPLGRYAAARRRTAAAIATAPDAGGGTPDAGGGAPGIHVHRCRYLHVPVLWPLTEPVQALLLALLAVLRHARDAAVLHGHRAYVPGLVAALAGALLRRPAVITVYGSDIHQQARGGHPLRRGWIRLALRRAARVVAVSQSLVAALEALGVEAARRRAVPSGVDTERFRPPADAAARAALRARLGLPAGARVFLSLNLFVPVKGHRRLVEAFARVARDHPGAMLVMTSEGPLRPAIEQQVQAAGLAARTRFTGFLDYDAIPDWIAAADVLVLPSLAEGMPLSILEGFACEKPLVGTAVGGTPELVPDERYGLLVPPGDAAALAAAMAAALNRRWDGAALRARAEAYAWPRIAARIEAVYGELQAR